MDKIEFQKELRSLINRCSLENGSDTPDFLLAEYLRDCLDAYEKLSRARDAWFGFKPFGRDR